MMTPQTGNLRKAAWLAFVAQLALGLAACNGAATTDGEPPVGEPIAHVAPPEGRLWQDVAAVTPEGGVVIGNPAAQLKLVEFASHTCHVCAEFSQNGAEAMNRYVNTGVISYEIRNLIRDPVDLSIATLARCGDPSIFHPLADAAWADYDSLIATAQANAAAIQEAAGTQAPDRFQTIGRASGLLDFFATRGVSGEQARTCLADVDGIQKFVDLADEQRLEFEVTGTPTFFLNGQRLNATAWRAVEPILQNAGAR